MSNIITPSNEQQEIIDLFNNDDSKSIYNVKIPAVPGAGKSSVLLLCAQKVFQKRCLILTYNKHLQLGVWKKIQDWGLNNVEVRTYHSAVSRAYGRVIQDDVKFIDALKAKPEFLNLLNCQVLMLDEVQDMTIAYYVFVEQLIKSLPQVQLILVGDVSQSINQYIGSRSEFLTSCEDLPGFSSGYIPQPQPQSKTQTQQVTSTSETKTESALLPRPWVTKQLTISYRLTPAMANFISGHVASDRKIIGGNLRSPNIKPRYLISKFNTMAKDLGRLIKDCITKYGHENVALIAPSIKAIRESKSSNPLAIVVREHLVGIPTYIPKEDEALNEDLIKGKLTICTWSSMKGCEKDCVIVANFDESYFQYYCHDWEFENQLPNVMYVAATRAIKELIVVADPNKTLRTIDLKRLKLDANLDGKLKPKPCKIVSFEDGDDSKTKPTSNPNSTKQLYYSISELLKHLDASIMHQLISMVKVERYHLNSEIKSELKQVNVNVCYPNIENVKFTVEFDEVSENPFKEIRNDLAKYLNLNLVNDAKDPKKRYYESVSFLYGLVIPAIVELKKNGVSKFATKAQVPKIVERFTQLEPLSYCITRAAYESFPEHFWDSVKAAYKVTPRWRSLEDWFKLALAENIFHENGHHTARQINHYNWINDDFVEDAVDCMLKTLQGLNGEFECKFNSTIGKYEICGIADFVTDQQVWEFKCAEEITNEHILQVACYLALSNRKQGILYPFLSGKLFSIEFISQDARDNFLKMILTKFDKRVTNELIVDIQQFKAKYKLL